MFVQITPYVIVNKNKIKKIQEYSEKNDDTFFIRIDDLVVVNGLTKGDCDRMLIYIKNQLNRDNITELDYKIEKCPSYDQLINKE